MGIFLLSMFILVPAGFMTSRILESRILRILVDKISFYTGKIWSLIFLILIIAVFLLSLLTMLLIVFIAILLISTLPNPIDKILAGILIIGFMLLNILIIDYR